MMQGDLIHLRYPVLFTVKIIHHYFLDKWVEINSVNEYKAFDELNDKYRASVLGNYNVESFFEIKPTNSTKLILDGNGLLFKPHALGFSVIGRSPGGASAQVAALDGSVRLQFWVRIIDPLFLKYSSGFAPIHAVEIEKATVLGEQDKLFKKVFFFTNEIGETTGHEFPQLANPAPPINGATSLELEPIVWKDNALQQAKKVLTSTNINNDDTWKKIYDTRYVTSEDLRRIELSNELPNDLFALIEIQEGDADTYNGYALHDQGNNNFKPPKFELHFKNRSTWWRYFNPPSGFSLDFDNSYFPLTTRGKFKVGNKDVANADASSPFSWYYNGDGEKERLMSDVHL